LEQKGLAAHAGLTPSRPPINLEKVMVTTT
jgi:hypothetical protein